MRHLVVQIGDSSQIVFPLKWAIIDIWWSFDSGDTLLHDLTTINVYFLGERQTNRDDDRYLHKHIYTYGLNNDA